MIILALLLLLVLLRLVLALKLAVKKGLLEEELSFVGFLSSLSDFLRDFWVSGVVVMCWRARFEWTFRFRLGWDGLQPISYKIYSNCLGYSY